MRRRQRLSDARGRRGFTLIEVLAALVIFSVAIVGVIEGIGTALSFQSDVAMRQRAAMLASNVLEEIKYGNDLSEGEESGQFEGDDAAFTWRTDIEKSDIENLMQVTATVSWGPTDKTKDYSIGTLMYDQGGGEEEQNQDQNNPDQGGNQGANPNAGANTGNGGGM